MPRRHLTDLDLGGSRITGLGTPTADTDAATRLYAKSDTVVTVAASDTPAALATHADYVCDGTADDVEIQAALDALPSNGGTVVLLAGTFTTTTAIYLETNQTLRGAGMGATTIQANQATVTTGVIKPKTPNTTGRIWVRDLKVLNTSGTNGGVGIDASDAAYVHVDACRVEGWATGIKVYDNQGDPNGNTFYSTYRDCLLWQNNIGFDFGGTKPNVQTIDSCRIRVRSGSATARGIRLGDVRGVTIIGGSVEPQSGTLTSTIGVEVTATAREIMLINPWLEALDTNLLVASGANRITVLGGTITSGLTADVTDAGTATTFVNTNVNGSLRSSAVPKTLFDANTILAATADDSPLALTVAASRIVGRKATGDIAAMTGAETSALLVPASIPIADAGGYYGTDTVEAALQELAAFADTIYTSVAGKGITITDAPGPKTSTFAATAAKVEILTGSGTWNKPANSLLHYVVAIGGGGGGGSGQRVANTTTNAWGGAAGGAGGYGDSFLATTQLGATEAYDVGVGGTGGAAVTGTGNGNNGTAGGITRFGDDYDVYSGAGAFGQGGNANGLAVGGLSGVGSDTSSSMPAIPYGGAAVLSGRQGGKGGGGTAATATGGAVDNVGPGSGGGAGGLTGSGSLLRPALNGGSGTWSGVFGLNTLGGAITNANAGTAGNNGAGISGSTLGGGGGSGGNGSNLSGTAGGAGGSGGVNGGGGGGGGNGCNANSGKGGDGGAGFLMVVSWIGEG